MDAYERQYDRVALFHDLMKAGIPVHARADDWYQEAEARQMSACPVKVAANRVRSQKVGPIPQMVALQLCAEIYQTNRQHWYTLSNWRCWWCVRCSKGGIPARLAASPDYTGCDRVTKRYAASWG